MENYKKKNSEIVEPKVEKKIPEIQTEVPKIQKESATVLVVLDNELACMDSKGNGFRVLKKSYKNAKKGDTIKV